MRPPDDESRPPLGPTGVRAWMLVGLTVLSCLGYGFGHVEGPMGDYVRQKADRVAGWLHQAAE